MPSVRLCILIAVCFGALVNAGALRRDNVAAYWKKLHALYKNSYHDDIASYCEEILDDLTAKDAAQLIENAAMTWTSPHMAGQVASVLGPKVADNKDLFVRVSYTIFGSFPNAPVNAVLARFLKDNEDLVDSKEWVQSYLNMMASSKVKRCGAGESRDCGVFQKNLVWVLRTFPVTSSASSKFLVDWSLQINDSRESGYLLKYAYVRMFPVILLMAYPASLHSIAPDREFSMQLAQTFRHLDLNDRLEVMEYLLWSFRLGDNLSMLEDDMVKVLRWIIMYAVVTDASDCPKVLQRLISMDAFRTLSLVWQMGRCSAKVTKPTLQRALEDKDSPFSFAVYLTHGEDVDREAWRKRKGLGKLHRLMLRVVPKANSSGNETPWKACRVQKKPLIPYEWSPPLGAENLSSKNILILARYLLYGQFGVPFDDTRMDISFSPEATDWVELPGMASALLELHCLKHEMYPAYRIQIKRFRRGVASEGDATRSTRRPRKPSRQRSSSSSDASSATSDTSSSSTFEFAVPANWPVQRQPEPSPDFIFSDDFSSLGSATWMGAGDRDKKPHTKAIDTLKNDTHPSDEFIAITFAEEKKNNQKLPSRSIFLEEFKRRRKPVETEDDSDNSSSMSEAQSESEQNPSIDDDREELEAKLDSILKRLKILNELIGESQDAIENKTKILPKGNEGDKDDQKSDDGDIKKDKQDKKGRLEKKQRIRDENVKESEITSEVGESSELGNSSEISADKQE